MKSALKEWAVAVDALLNGQTLMLLRKGGIREEGGRFNVEHHRVWLYPTYEHQRPELLKLPYQEQVEPVSSGWHPEMVLIQGWAVVDHILEVEREAVVEALQPFHIWNERFVTERLKWKPRSPLYVLLLRAYRLSSPYHIPYRDAYGSCKSWIDLDEDYRSQPATPVLCEAEYQRQVSQILERVAHQVCA